MPRTLKNDTPDDIEETLWFTEGALEAEPDAADFAAQILPWYDELDAVRKAIKQPRRELVKKRGAAKMRDGDLDDGAEDFADDLLKAVGKDRNDPRYRRYFKVPISRFKKLDRLTEATTVESWKASIAAEPEATVAAHAEPLAALATASREATQAALAAEGERNAVGGRVWDPFVTRLDAFRDALHADLVKRGQTRNKPRDWAERFFEVESRPTPTTPTTPAAPPT